MWRTAVTEDDLFFLPKEVRDGLARARSRDRKASGGRLRVQAGEVWCPITAFDDEGFEVAIEVAPKLRGLVEIHEGPRLLRSVLIVATERSENMMRYTFKRTTAARTTAPLDYERSTEQPSGYLGSG